MTVCQCVHHSHAVYCGERCLSALNMLLDSEDGTVIGGLVLCSLPLQRNKSLMYDTVTPPCLSGSLVVMLTQPAALCERRKLRLR